MRPVLHLFRTTLALALALPLLAASLGCDDCEEMCHHDHEDCLDGDEEQRAYCDAELSQCLGICVSQPRDRQF